MRGVGQLLSFGVLLSLWHGGDSGDGDSGVKAMTGVLSPSGFFASLSSAPPYSFFLTYFFLFDTAV